MTHLEKALALNNVLKGKIFSAIFYALSYDFFVRASVLSYSAQFSVPVIHFTGNEAGVEGARCLGKAIGANSTLESLYACSIKMGPEGARYFSLSLQVTNHVMHFGESRTPSRHVHTHTYIHTYVLLCVCMHSFVHTLRTFISPLPPFLFLLPPHFQLSFHRSIYLILVFLCIQSIILLFILFCYSLVVYICQSILYKM